MKFTKQHNKKCGYKNSIDMWINTVYHVSLGTLSYHCCRKCNAMICSYCNKLDVKDNRTKHQFCYDNALKKKNTLEELELL